MSRSRIEIPLQYALSTHINHDMSDLDQMMTLTSLSAANRSVEFSETYQGSIIRIYTHTGYVRLIREKDNTELQLSDLYTLTGADTRHGPAILSDNKQYLLAAKYFLSNDDHDAAELKGFKTIIYVIVCYTQSILASTGD